MDSVWQAPLPPPTVSLLLPALVICLFAGICNLFTFTLFTLHRHIRPNEQQPELFSLWYPVNNGEAAYGRVWKFNDTSIMAETYSISCSLSQPKHVHNICFADIACCVSGGVVYVCVCGGVSSMIWRCATRCTCPKATHTHTHTHCVLPQGTACLP